MEENKTFEINEEAVVLDPEEVEIVNEVTEVESTEEPEEEKKSNLPNMLLVGAAIGGVAAIGYKVFKKVKTKRINKELERIKEELVEQLTEDGSIKDYTEDSLEEMSKYIYFKKHSNL